MELLGAQLLPLTRRVLVAVVAVCIAALFVSWVAPVGKAPIGVPHADVPWNQRPAKDYRSHLALAAMGAIMFLLYLGLRD